jgi:hypothetical protein
MRPMIIRQTQTRNIPNLLPSEGVRNFIYLYTLKKKYTQNKYTEKKIEANINMKVYTSKILFVIIMTCVTLLLATAVGTVLPFVISKYLIESPGSNFLFDARESAYDPTYILSRENVSDCSTYID